MSNWAKIAGELDGSAAEQRLQDKIEQVEEAIKQFDAEHRPMWSGPNGYTEDPIAGKNPIGCRICFPNDGSWPCITREIVNDLR